MRRLLLTFMMSLGIFAMLGQRAFAQEPSDTPGRSQAAEVSQPDPCAGFKHTGVFGRFYESYINHLHDTGESSEPAPAFRGVPPAVDSPPFPYSTWPMGGTPAIRYPDTRTSPLIDTLN